MAWHIMTEIIPISKKSIKKTPWISNSTNPCYILSSFPHLFPLSPNLGEKLKRNWFSPHFVNLKATAFCSFSISTPPSPPNHNYNWVSAQINSRSLFKWAQIKLSSKLQSSLLIPTNSPTVFARFTTKLQGQPNSLCLCTSAFTGPGKQFPVNHNAQVSAYNFHQRFKNSIFWSPLLPTPNLTCSASAEAM